MRKYNQGWKDDSERHSLARRGIKTGKKSLHFLGLALLGGAGYVGYRMGKKKRKHLHAAGNKELDAEIMKKVDAAFKDKEKEIIEWVKESKDEPVQVSYGFAPAWRDWFSPELDEEVNYKGTDDIHEQVVWSFEELENRLGKKGIIIWGDEGDGSVMWAGTEKAYKKMYPEED